MVTRWIKISLLFFIIAGILGVFLRYFSVDPLSVINYKYLLHTHSHVAFMGWVFNALFAGMVYVYLPRYYDTSYHRLFILLQIAVLGMLFTFPWEGYGLYSIIFSTLHIFLSYWFAIKFHNDTREYFPSGNFPISLEFIRWALIFMVLSSIGPFALGYIMAQEGKTSHWYRLAIYFYLHFQYNGWFTFGVLGLLCRWLEQTRMQLPIPNIKRFLFLMAWACFPTFALSALWIQPPSWVYVLGFIGGLLQMVALIYGWQIFNKVKKEISGKFKPVTALLFALALIAFGIKIIMQMAGAFPVIAELAFRFRNLTIGFLHLVFLGFVSLFLLGWIFQYEFFKNNTGPGVRLGLGILISGIILSELCLFVQPALVFMGTGGLSHFNTILLLVSAWIPLALILIWYSQNKPSMVTNH